eukprot:7089948-Alexandrium_andersonii.AAC.1
MSSRGQRASGKGRSSTLACVSLSYKFVPQRNRRVIRAPDHLESLSPWEVEPFRKIRDSGILDSDPLPQG